MKRWQVALALVAFLAATWTGFVAPASAGVATLCDDGTVAASPASPETCAMHGGVTETDDFLSPDDLRETTNDPESGSAMLWIEVGIVAWFVLGGLAIVATKALGNGGRERSRRDHPAQAYQAEMRLRRTRR